VPKVTFADGQVWDVTVRTKAFIEMLNSVRENISLWQALNNIEAAHERQKLETGENFPTFGADYGAIDRRVVTKYLLALNDKRTKSVFRELISKRGPNLQTIYMWERKYKNDGYTKQ